MDNMWEDVYNNQGIIIKGMYKAHFIISQKIQCAWQQKGKNTKKEKLYIRHTGTEIKTWDNNKSTNMNTRQKTLHTKHARAGNKKESARGKYGAVVHSRLQWMRLQATWLSVPVCTKTSGAAAASVVENYYQKRYHRVKCIVLTNRPK